jgi:signal transduction histidine kinase
VFYIIPFIQDAEETSAEYNQEEVARNIAREIDLDLSRLTNLLYKISQEKIIMEMETENQTDLLKQYVNISEELESAFVMNATGWFVSGTVEDMSVYQTMSWGFLDFFQIPFVLGENYFGAPASYYNDTLISTFVSVPIKSDLNETVGVISGTMLINDLIPRIYNYPLKEDQVVYLVDEVGTVLAHSKIDLLSLEDGALSLNYSHHPLVNHTLHEQDFGSHHYIVNGTSFFGVHTVLESNGWRVIVETPRSTILSEIDNLIENLLLINVFLFGFTLIITIIFTQQITSMQKRSERQLKEAQEALVKKEKLAILGQLAGGIGHELRNPLSAINNAAYFLNMALEESDSEIVESISIIETEIMKSNNIIRSLLSYARPKPLLLKKTDLNNVIQESLKSIDIPDNIKVLNELNTTTPSIQADSDQLVQVFNNLISNAIQATPEGGQVSIKSKTLDDTWLVISITDNGVGISSENLEKVFTPLFTTKAKGIGLGLVITKTIVEAHQGSISLESEVGKGSTFEVKLPLNN